MKKENLIETIHYKTGYDNPKDENKEYFDLENKLKEEGKSVSSGWEGDFFVSVFEMNNKIYKVINDMEYGIPYSIEIYKKDIVDKEKLKKINEMINQEKSHLKENKEAYKADMKSLKEELSKDASDWDCDVINNMSRCSQERKVNINLSLAELKHLEEVKNSIKNGINVLL